MIIFCYLISTKCYGDTVIRRYRLCKCNCVTASQCHCVKKANETV